MNPSQLQNEEKKQEWTIVYDRAVPPAHSATFASQVVGKPQPAARRGVNRTLTPPACRWVEQSSTENIDEPNPSFPVCDVTMSQEVTTEVSEVTSGSTLPTSTSTNDANPRLPQRLPVGSCLSPVKKPKDSQHQSQTD
ncbi:hypothetical protein FisN_9Hh298 [Fistulifera solaris]|jgi:hypothetical protein|uniref:Uncharacterized protein n=1 Tax=Fistulifera solaris TaxID=1519565 RepID=A0A1Z5JBQ5_FISSO|nr:hypothetical protein FisN_9Hh298 [Fistulifera solaris]|eukprot:GAX11201.1 hypothetical protein FisN_9Hh298 [Fistulifera solaris]